MACLVVPFALHVRYWQHRCMPSSSTRSWVWQTRRTRRHGGLDLVLGIDRPWRLPRRINVFVFGAFSYAPPSLAPTMVCPWLCVWLPHLRQPRQLQSHHLRRSCCYCGGMLEYIRGISIFGRLELYPYHTISVEEAPYPPSHVPYIFSPKAQANTIHNINYLL